MKSVIAAILLNILPVYALAELSKKIGIEYIIGYLVVVSILTIQFYRSDKRKAQNQEWRTPESTLYLLELAGGWLAAFLSQRKFRHKISKTEYIQTFWMIVLIQNYVAFDYINKWHYTQTAWKYIEPFME